MVNKILQQYIQSKYHKIGDYFFSFIRKKGMVSFFYSLLVFIELTQPIYEYEMEPITSNVTAHLTGYYDGGALPSCRQAGAVFCWRKLTLESALNSLCVIVSLVPIPF